MQVIDRLKHNFKQFQGKYAEGHNSIMRKLAVEGQHPEVMVIACADSRVDPAILFGSKPGELFVVRSVANIVPHLRQSHAHPSTSAALEFAVCYLGVKHLIILGHSNCGGIHAALHSQELHQNDHITDWVSVIAPPKDAIDENDAAKQCLVKSYNNCASYPWLFDKLAGNELHLHGWFIDIENAELSAYDSEAKLFKPLSE